MVPNDDSTCRKDVQIPAHRQQPLYDTSAEGQAPSAPGADEEAPKSAYKRPIAPKGKRRSSVVALIKRIRSSGEHVHGFLSGKPNRESERSRTRPNRTKSSWLWRTSS